MQLTRQNSLFLRTLTSRRLLQQFVTEGVALTQTALQYDRHQVDHAERDDIKAQEVGSFLDRGKFAQLCGTQILVAAENCKLDRVCGQQTQRNDDGPHRHMEAEYRAANVFMARARINVEQTLTYGNDEQNDRKQEAEAGVLIRKSAPKIQHDAEAHAKHRDPL